MAALKNWIPNLRKQWLCLDQMVCMLISTWNVIHRPAWFPCKSFSVSLLWQSNSAAPPSSGRLPQESGRRQNAEFWGEFVEVNRGRGGNYIPQGPHSALQHNQVHARYLIPSLQSTLDTCCSCAVAVTLWPLAQLWPPLLGNNSRRLPENSRRTLQLRTLGHRNQLFALAAGKQWFFNSQFRVGW